MFDTNTVNALGRFGDKLEGEQWDTMMDKYLYMSSDAAMADGMVQENAIKNAKEFNNQLTKIQTSIQRVSYEALADPIKELGDYLDRLNPDRIDQIADAAAKATKAIVALVAIRKATQLGSWMHGQYKSLAGLGKAPRTTGGLSGFGIQKVHVVNMPLGGFGGSTVSGRRGAKRVPGLDKARGRATSTVVTASSVATTSTISKPTADRAAMRLGSKALKVVPILGNVIAAYELISAFSDLNTALSAEKTVSPAASLKKQLEASTSSGVRSGYLTGQYQQPAVSQPNYPTQGNIRVGIKVDQEGRVASATATSDLPGVAMED